MALILNIDTSTANCSVCIADDGNPIAVKEDVEAYTHARVLTPFITQLLDECGLTLRQLDAVAVSEGPGSYTGMRIGTSVAKGICLGANLPLIAVGSLPALAAQLKKKYPAASCFITIMDSRKDELYMATYSYDLEELMAPMPINVNSIDHINIPITEAVVGGSGTQKLRSTSMEQVGLIDTQLFFSSVNMTTISFLNYKNKAFKNLIYFEPLYLKSVFVKQNKSLPFNG